jgi:hypothetical protein
MISPSEHKDRSGKKDIFELIRLKKCSNFSAIRSKKCNLVLLDLY